MNVKRSVLEQKSDSELEEYIQKASRFTPEAIKHASEILKYRGRQFSDEELDNINSQINIALYKNETVVNPSEKKASNLILISAGLGIINIFFSPEVFNSFSQILIGVITIVIIFGIGIGIRSGIQWIKYVFIGLTVLGLFSFPIIVNTIKVNMIAGTVNIIQSLLQIIATVLLFITIKKETAGNTR